MIRTVDQAIERLYDLNVGVIGSGPERHERPHKPLLLLAALDLLDEGLATPDHIPWCDALRQHFTRRFQVVRTRDDDNTPDNPFRYLAGDGFWEPLEPTCMGIMPFRSQPLVRDFHSVFARFTDGFDVIVANPVNRRRLRQALVARYFPNQATFLLDPAASAVPDPTARAADDQTDAGTEYGRSPAFRRKILAIYDHQCTACGLRIKLPVKDVSFIDAAHLIPFADSHNDHPTNGLALCKNHHWAMDRALIAPGPDGVWHVARSVIRRRSTGEAELADLTGKPVLPPHDDAFRPDPAALRWRWERLSA